MQVAYRSRMILEYSVHSNYSINPYVGRPSDCSLLSEVEAQSKPYVEKGFHLMNLTCALPCHNLSSPFYRLGIIC